MFTPSLIHWLSSTRVRFLSLSPANFFETSVNIDFIYLIDITRDDTGTLHKQWRNALETPLDERKWGGE